MPRDAPSKLHRTGVAQAGRYVSRLQTKTKKFISLVHCSAQIRPYKVIGNLLALKQEGDQLKSCDSQKWFGSKRTPNKHMK
jgi:hypothetical protein